VQGWANDSSTNYGWSFHDSGDNALTIRASDWTTQSQRPLLSVSYNPVRYSFNSGTGALTVIGTRGWDTLNLSSDGTFVTIGTLVTNVAPGSVTSILVVGRAGNDTIDLTNVDTGHGFNESTLNGHITVQGDAGDDLITGGPTSESFTGGDGSDTIDGGAGNDTIDGGAVYDRIHGGDGDDSIHGSTGDDALFGDRQAYGGAGSPGNDVIWGDEGNDDIIGGHWAITSNDGNDRMYGGSGSDRFFYYGANQGNDIITDDRNDAAAPTDIDWITFGSWSNSVTLHLDSPYIGVQQNLSGGGSITLTTLNSIENIWTGTGNDYLYGDDRNNYLDGQAGDDHIEGNGGADFLAGYDGYDVMYGGSGDDVFWPEYGGGEMHGEDGNDTYDFTMTYGNNYYVFEYHLNGTDNTSDTLDFSGGAGPVNINLASTSPQSFAGITLTLSDGTGIENAYCSLNAFFNWGDTLYGNSRPNILKGGVGDDYIYGYDGNDELRGEDGSDHIYGGNGDDRAYGGAGNDFIYGEDGGDNMYGDDGADRLDAGQSDGDADNAHGGNGDDSLFSHDAPDVWDSDVEHIF
jgi:Ca2+-binding RTX toxin-like protein